MNYNSNICRFIAEHDNWYDILTNDYTIFIKQDGPLAIFNYGIKCNFADPIVQEARGIIINTVTCDVVCWPFRKFGEYTESYADTIDWYTARVQDKIDGSIVKMWHNGTSWTFSTNACIDANKATILGCTHVTFMELIKSANNYADLLDIQDSLDPNKTYIFEIVSPDTQIVIKYRKCHLYHIGTRNNITGQETTEYIGIDKPTEYPLHSLEDCIRAAKELNASADGNVHDVKMEGYVVVDRHWNRIKVKSPEYLMLHSMVANSNVSKERIVGIIRDKRVNIADMCNAFPNLAHYFKYYEYRVAELEYQAHVLCDIVRRFYKECGYDKKLIAGKISKHKLSYIGFHCLNNDKSGEDILNEQPLSMYCKYIIDYTPERIATIFYGND